MIITQINGTSMKRHLTLQTMYHSKCLQQELMEYGNIYSSASEQWRCLQLDLLSMTQEIRESESVKRNKIEHTRKRVLLPYI